jgi:hypothetical protein
VKWVERLIVILILVVGGVLALFVCFTSIWDGRFELTVNIVGPGERPKWVWLGQEPNKDQAERFLAVMLKVKRERMDDGFLSLIVDPFYGQPISLHVRLSGSDSPIFGALGETQYGQYLVVVAEMPDGQRVGKIVDIPDHNESTQVTISLP